MKLKMDAVDEVRNRLAIEDVIGEYVTLKRAGRNFRGLSPFTNEKTPSFMVSPEKQIWHDFSSNKGGNIFGFVMEMEGVDFKGALELLARKAGIDLEQYRGSGQRRGPDKERLYAALEAAARFYQVQLKANKVALDYVLGARRLSKATVLAWRLGYSPNGGSALAAYLKKRGFSESEMRQAGLVSGRGAQPRDMFRGRLMIPLMDPQGQVIGFTARQLEEEGAFGPKYINTPQTPLYDKSRHIFGLHLAKQSIRESKFAVITEGNLDVISSHQAGVTQAVATAGTALTEYHLKGLARFAADIRISFDSDKAGLAATERAITIASKLHVSLHIIDLKGGKDPDELIKKDPKLWQKAVQNYQYAIDWLINFQKQHYDLATAAGKREFSDALLPTIGNLDDAVEQDHYLNLLSGILAVSRDSLAAKLAKTNASEHRPLKKRRQQSPAPPSAEQIEITRAEDHLLSLMLKQPELRSQLEFLTADMFSRDQARALFKVFKQQPAARESGLNRLNEVADYVKILGLQYEELYQGLEFNELIYEATRLQARLVESYVKTQKLSIAQKLGTADAKQTEELLTHARQLDNLLRVNLGDNIHA